MTETQYTRMWRDEGKDKARINLSNRKPYRTKAQKREAKTKATQRKDGAWRCDVPVSFHRPRGD